ncbi:hypothetical protein [Amycolatopsis sp. cmx-4-68]
MGEEKRSSEAGQPQQGGEPTPIFDAVFTAACAKPNTRNAAGEPGESGQ